MDQNDSLFKGSAAAGGFPGSPALHIPLADIRALLRLARWASSGDNTQPFTFEWDGLRLSILFNPSGEPTLLDVEGATTHIAVGMLVSKKTFTYL